MARDYKPRTRSKPRRKPTPAWVWMVAGLSIGLFVAFLIYLKSGGGSAPAARLVEAPVTVPAEREARGVKKEPPAPIPPHSSH